MLLALLFATQTIRQGTIPIDCPEAKWATAGVPYGSQNGPGQRYLILSNGPEFIGTDSVPDKVDHVNLYWGKIPFEGQDLRLRVYIDHYIDPKSTLDNLEIRFCMGVKDGGGSSVKMTRRVATEARTPETEPHQYIDPGQAMPFAHLAQKWQSSMPSGSSVEVPDDSGSGDVADIAMTLKQKPENLQYGNQIAELDLHSDRVVKGRSLVVRTVARKPGGQLGSMRDETCAQPGAGERGWWPQADVWVRSNPQAPIEVDPKSAKPFSAYLRVCEVGGADWAMFNKLNSKGQPVTNNLADKFGTKNSGLWGVNALYRIYVRSTGEKAPVASNIACFQRDQPVSHVLSGPFSDRDDPWALYAANRLKVAMPGYLNIRKPTDYDCVDLGKVLDVGSDTGYFEYFVTTAGASSLPTKWLIQNPTRRN